MAQPIDPLNEPDSGFGQAGVPDPSVDPIAPEPAPQQDYRLPDLSGQARLPQIPSNAQSKAFRRTIALAAQPAPQPAPQAGMPQPGAGPMMPMPMPGMPTPAMLRLPSPASVKAQLRVASQAGTLANIPATDPNLSRIRGARPWALAPEQTGQVDYSTPYGGWMGYGGAASVSADNANRRREQELKAITGQEAAFIREDEEREKAPYLLGELPPAPVDLATGKPLAEISIDDAAAIGPARYVEMLSNTFDAVQDEEYREKLQSWLDRSLPVLYALEPDSSSGFASREVSETLEGEKIMETREDYRRRMATAFEQAELPEDRRDDSVFKEEHEWKTRAQKEAGEGRYKDIQSGLVYPYTSQIGREAYAQELEGLSAEINRRVTAAGKSAYGMRDAISQLYDSLGWKRKPGQTEAQRRASAPEPIQRMVRERLKEAKEKRDEAFKEAVEEANRKRIAEAPDSNPLKVFLANLEKGIASGWEGTSGLLGAQKAGSYWRAVQEDEELQPSKGELKSFFNSDGSFNTELTGREWLQKLAALTGQQAPILLDVFIGTKGIGSIANVVKASNRAKNAIRLVGGSQRTMKYMFAEQYGESFRSNVLNGMNPEEADKAAMVEAYGYAVVASVGEALPGLTLVKKAGGDSAFKTFAKNTFRELTEEGTVEFSQELLGTFARRVATDFLGFEKPDYDLVAALESGFSGMLFGGGVGAVTSTVAALAVATQHAKTEADTAVHFAAMLEGVRAGGKAAEDVWAMPEQMNDPDAEVSDEVLQEAMSRVALFESLTPRQRKQLIREQARHGEAPSDSPKWFKEGVAEALGRRSEKQRQRDAEELGYTQDELEGVTEIPLTENEKKLQDRPESELRRVEAEKASLVGEIKPVDLDGGKTATYRQKAEVKGVDSLLVRATNMLNHDAVVYEGVDGDGNVVYTGKGGVYSRKTKRLIGIESGQSFQEGLSTVLHEIVGHSLRQNKASAFNDLEKALTGGFGKPAAKKMLDRMRQRYILKMLAFKLDEETGLTPEKRKAYLAEVNSKDTTWERRAEIAEEVQAGMPEAVRDTMIEEGIGDLTAELSKIILGRRSDASLAVDVKESIPSVRARLANFFKNLLLTAQGMEKRDITKESEFKQQRAISVAALRAAIRGISETAIADLRKLGQLAETQRKEEEAKRIQQKEAEDAVAAEQEVADEAKPETEPDASEAAPEAAPEPKPEAQAEPAAEAAPEAEAEADREEAVQDEVAAPAPDTTTSGQGDGDAANSVVSDLVNQSTKDRAKRAKSRGQDKLAKMLEKLASTMSFSQKVNEALNYLYDTIRTASDTDYSGYLVSSEDAAKAGQSTSEVYAREEAGWFYRGPESLLGPKGWTGKKGNPKYSGNVTYSDALISDMDAFITGLQKQGIDAYYKVPNQATWDARHDPLSVYLSESLTAAQEAQLANILSQHVRSKSPAVNKLTGRKVADGVFYDPNPTKADKDAVVARAESTGNKELADAVKAYLEDSSSTAQVHAANLLLDKIAQAPDTTTSAPETPAGPVSEPAAPEAQEAAEPAEAAEAAAEAADEPSWDDVANELDEISDYESYLDDPAQIEEWMNENYLDSVEAAELSINDFVAGKIRDLAEKLGVSVEDVQSKLNDRRQQDGPAETKAKPEPAKKKATRKKYAKGYRPSDVNATIKRYTAEGMTDLEVAQWLAKGLDPRDSHTTKVSPKVQLQGILHKAADGGEYAKQTEIPLNLTEGTSFTLNGLEAVVSNGKILVDGEVVPLNGLATIPADAGSVKPGPGLPSISHSLQYDPNSRYTQRKSTKGTYQKAAVLARGRTMDYGAGLGLGFDILSEESGEDVSAQAFEPFTEGWKGKRKPTFEGLSSNKDIPDASQDTVFNFSVLNVLRPDVRRETVSEIGRILAPGGIAYITARTHSDVEGATKKEKQEGDHRAYLVTQPSGKKTYQKGFNNTELRDYVAEVLGPEYIVEFEKEGPNGKQFLNGASVKVTRAGGVDHSLVSFMLQAEGLAQEARETTPKIQRQIEWFRTIGMVPRDAIRAMMGDRPEYLRDVLKFMIEQRQKVIDGKVTARDVAKAYIMTVASQGSNAVFAETVEEGSGFSVPEFYQEEGGRVRPEEAAAAWLAFPAGQKALDNIEAGIFNPDDWAGAFDVRSAYGDDRLNTNNVAGRKVRTKPVSQATDKGEIITVPKDIKPTMGSEKRELRTYRWQVGGRQYAVREDRIDSDGWYAWRPHGKGNIRTALPANRKGKMRLGRVPKRAGFDIDKHSVDVMQYKWNDGTKRYKIAVDDVGSDRRVYVEPVGVGKDVQNLAHMTEIAKAINEAGGDTNKMSRALENLSGIGVAKLPFIKHFFGFGDAVTVDAVEINVWFTGVGDTKKLAESMDARMRGLARTIKRINDNLSDKVFSREVSKRVEEQIKIMLEEGALEGVPMEYAAHILHHWIWDAAKGSQTTHRGLMHAMQSASLQAPDTKEFKDWFGDSKVVDADGKPLVVYHGTDAGPVNALSGGTWFTESPSESAGYTNAASLAIREKRNKKYTLKQANGAYDGQRLPYTGIIDDAAPYKKGKAYATDNGVFVYRGKGQFDVLTDVVNSKITTGDPDGHLTYDEDGNSFIRVETGDSKDARAFVSDYAEQTSGYKGGIGGRIYSAYLSIQNPIELGPQEANRLALRLGRTRQEIDSEIQKYIDQGYDGIVTLSDEASFMEDAREDWGGVPRQFIPFYPEQIKSATANVGTFDPTSPDIRYSLGRVDDSPVVLDNYLSNDIIARFKANEPEFRKTKRIPKGQEQEAQRLGLRITDYRIAGMMVDELTTSRVYGVKQYLLGKSKADAPIGVDLDEMVEGMESAQNYVARPSTNAKQPWTQYSLQPLPPAATDSFNQHFGADFNELGYRKETDNVTGKRTAIHKVSEGFRAASGNEGAPANGADFPAAVHARNRAILQDLREARRQISKAIGKAARTKAISRNLTERQAEAIAEEARREQEQRIGEALVAFMRNPSKAPIGLRDVLNRLASNLAVVGQKRLDRRTKILDDGSTEADAVYYDHDSNSVYKTYAIEEGVLTNAIQIQDVLPTSATAKGRQGPTYATHDSTPILDFLERINLNNEMGIAVYTEVVGITTQNKLLVKQPYVLGLKDQVRIEGEGRWRREITTTETTHPALRQAGFNTFDAPSLDWAAWIYHNGVPHIAVDLHGGNVQLNEEGRPFFVDMVMRPLRPSEQRLLDIPPQPESQRRELSGKTIADALSDPDSVESGTALDDTIQFPDDFMSASLDLRGAPSDNPQGHPVVKWSELAGQSATVFVYDRMKTGDAVYEFDGVRVVRRVHGGPDHSYTEDRWKKAGVATAAVHVLSGLKNKLQKRGTEWGLVSIGGRDQLMSNADFTMFYADILAENIKKKKITLNTAMRILNEHRARVLEGVDSITEVFTGTVTKLQWEVKKFPSSKEKEYEREIEDIERQIEDIDRDMFANDPDAKERLNDLVRERTVLEQRVRKLIDKRAAGSDTVQIDERGAAEVRSLPKDVQAAVMRAHPNAKPTDRVVGVAWSGPDSDSGNAASLMDFAADAISPVAGMEHRIEIVPDNAEKVLDEKKKQAIPTFRPDGSRKYKYKIAREPDIAKLWDNPWKSIQDFRDAMLATTFNARKALYGGVGFRKVDGKVTDQMTGQQIGKEKYVKRGMPSTVAMLEAMEVPEFAKLETNTVVSAIKFDLDALEVGSAESFGFMDHPSYPHNLPGVHSGRLESYVHVSKLRAHADAEKGLSASEVQKKLGLPKYVSDAMPHVAVPEEFGGVPAITSIVSNSLSLDGLSADERASVESLLDKPYNPLDTLGMFSPLGAFVDSLTQRKFTRDQFLGLAKKNGVKDDEMHWSGFSEWVKDKPRFTLRELKKFVRTNRVTVSEVVIGRQDTADIEASYAAQQKKANEHYWREDLKGEIVKVAKAAGMPASTAVNLGSQSIGEITKNIARGHSSAKGAINSVINVKLAKGDLLKPSEKEAVRQALLESDFPDIYESMVEEIVRDEMRLSRVSPVHVQGAGHYENWALEGGQKYREFLFYSPGVAERWEAPHWGRDENMPRESEPRNRGLIMHARTTLRTLPNGKTVLFIEEVQSDLHQAGRVGGYLDEQELKSLEANLNKITDEMFALQRKFIDSGVFENDPADPDTWSYAKTARRARRWARWMREQDGPAVEKFKNQIFKMADKMESLEAERKKAKEAFDKTKAKPPVAPFAKVWPSFLAKRLVRLAVEEGLDGVGWAPGSMHAERYTEGLRSSVDQIIVRSEAYPYSPNRELLDRLGISDPLLEYDSPFVPNVLDVVDDPVMVLEEAKKRGWEPGYASEGRKAKPKPSKKEEIELRSAIKFLAQEVEPKSDAPADAWAVETYVGGREVFTEYASDKKELKDLLGATMADEVIAQAPRADSDDVIFEGEGIKFGGHGHRQFYDKNFRSDMKRIGKPWGAKVGGSEFGVQTMRGEKTKEMHTLMFTDSMTASVGKQGLSQYSLQYSDIGKNAAHTDLWWMSAGGIQMERASVKTPLSFSPKFDTPAEPRDHTDIAEAWQALVRGKVDHGKKAISLNGPLNNLRWSYAEIDEAVAASARQLRLMFPGYDVYTFGKANEKNDIRISHSLGRNEPGSVLSIPEDQWYNTVRRKYQDKFEAIKRLQEAIKAAGGEVPEDQDVYLYEELYHGKLGRDIEILQRNYVAPLMRALADSGLTQKRIDELAMARFAKERNEYVRDINPNFQADYFDADGNIIDYGGSGMSDKVAADIIEAAEANGDWAKAQPVLAKLDALNDMKLKTLVKSGMLSKESAAAMKERYPNYVPLVGHSGETLQPELSFLSSGPADPELAQAVMNVSTNKYSVSETGTKRTTGRTTLAESPVVASVQLATNAMILSRRNQVAQALLKMVYENPDPNMWEIDKHKSNYYFDRQAGEVRKRTEKPTAAYNERVVDVRVNGELVSIYARDQRIADAMRNLRSSQLNWGLKIAGMANRYYSQMRTQYNPAFMPINFFRDWLTAGIHTAGEIDNAFAASVMGKSWKVMRAIYNYERWSRAARTGKDAKPPKGSQYWRDMMERYERAGGRVSFLGLQDFESRRKELDNMVSDLTGSSGKVRNALKPARALMGWASDVNAMAENASRLAAFETAINRGWSDAKAASLARNLTVNFNRRGEWTSGVGSLFAFFNASVQGNTRMLQAAIKSKGVRRIAAGITTFSASLALFNSLFGGEDENGVSYWASTPAGMKARNLIIIIPGTGGQMIRFPLPWGYNVFHAFGTNLMDSITGTQGVGGAAWAQTMAIADSFNPIGQSATFLQQFTPTAAEPFVQWSQNTAWHGGPIYKEPFPGQDPPNAFQHFKSVREASRLTAEFLNDLSGGNQFKSGRIDLNPEMLDHASNALFGAAGTFTADVIELAASLGDPGKIEVKDIPFLNKFYSKPSEYSSEQDFFGIDREIDSAVKLYKQYVQAGMAEEADDLLKRKGDLMSSQELMDEANKLQKRLQDKADTLREMGDSRDDRMEVLEDLMRRYNEKGSDATKALYKGKSYKSILQPMADVAITMGVDQEWADQFVEKGWNPKTLMRKIEEADTTMSPQQVEALIEDIGKERTKVMKQAAKEVRDIANLPKWPTERD